MRRSRIRTHVQHLPNFLTRPGLLRMRVKVSTDGPSESLLPQCRFRFVCSNFNISLDGSSAPVAGPFGRHTSIRAPDDALAGAETLGSPRLDESDDVPLLLRRQDRSAPAICVVHLRAAALVCRHARHSILQGALSGRFAADIAKLLPHLCPLQPRLLPQKPCLRSLEGVQALRVEAQSALRHGEKLVGAAVLSRKLCQLDPSQRELHYYQTLSDALSKETFRRILNHPGCVRKFRRCITIT